MYIQLYLFTILYFHWIATNMAKYLLYLVLFVYNSLSVFTHVYVKRMEVNYCIKKLYKLSLEIQGPFTHMLMYVYLLPD